MVLSQWGRTGWDPFAELRRLQSDVDRIFERPAGFQARRGYPPVNLWVSDNSVAVTAELPGLSGEDIDLSIAEDTLTIRGERSPAANDNDVAWHRRERPTGGFARTIELPFRVDPNKVQARFANGMLEIEMHRPDSDLPRRIEVKAG